MKEIIVYLLLSLFGIGTAYFGWQHFQKNDWVHPGVVDEILSDSTRVFSSRMATKRVMADSLRQVSEEAFERIQKKNERIKTLTTLAGRVITVRDTVFVAEPIAVPQNDTTLTFTQTFSDSLFAATAQLVFRDNRVSALIDLEQLRDLRIDITQTERNRQIITYITSPDFSLNEYRTLQMQPEPEKSSLFWHGFAGGSGIILLMWLLLGR